MRALVAALLFAPLHALADPVSIFAAVASVASAVGMTVPTLAAVTIAAANVGYQVYGASSARRKARKEAARQRAEYNASLQDRSITTLTANPPWRVIYGRCITGGDIVAIFTSDKTATREDGSSYTKPDCLKHLVVVLAAHQCQAIHEVYIDGVALGALDGNGWVTTGEFYKSGQTTRQFRTIAAGGAYNAGTAVTVLGAYLETGSGIETLWTPATVTLTSGNTIINNGNSYSVVVEFTISTSAARVRVSKALGASTQTVDTYLNSVVPSQWDSNCRLRGLTYCVVTLDLEETRFQGGPPNLTFDVSGKLIYDTRTATTAWSQNPALIIRDFLVSQWGYQCASTDIDETLCNAAANACDALITLNVGGVTTANQPKYTCNGAFSTADSREAILEDLCESMAGFATYGATWGIVAGVWTASVMTLTDDDLDGQIEVVQAGAGMDGIFNGVRGQYITVDKSTPSDFDSYQNSTFVTADGQALWSDLTLPFTNNKYRARNLARIFVERARQGLVIRYPAKLRAWPLQIGDRVTVNSTEYRFSSKTFRVTDWQFGASTAVQLTLQEDVASVYDLADAATADPAPNTALPNPWVVAAVTNVTVTSSTSTVLKSDTNAIIPRVLVSWSALTDAYIVNAGGYVDVAWIRPGGQWVQQSVPGDQTSVYITGPAHGEPIVIRVNARNSLQAVGPSSYVYHTVSGAATIPLGINLIYNSAFESGLNGWSEVESFGPEAHVGVNFNDTWRLLPKDAPWTSVAFVQQENNGTNDSHYWGRVSNKIFVKPNTRYILSGYLQPNRCTGSLFCRVYNSAGTLIADAQGGGPTGDNSQANANSLDKFTRVSSAFTTGPTAAYVKVIWRKGDTTVTPNSYLWVTRLMLEEATASSGVSPWRPGAEVPIDGVTTSGLVVEAATTRVFSITATDAAVTGTGTGVVSTEALNASAGVMDGAYDLTVRAFISVKRSGSGATPPYIFLSYSYDGGSTVAGSKAQDVLHTSGQYQYYIVSFSTTCDPGDDIYGAVAVRAGVGCTETITADYTELEILVTKR
jgi:hypothetical protein